MNAGTTQDIWGSSALGYEAACVSLVELVQMTHWYTRGGEDYCSVGCGLSVSGKLHNLPSHTFLQSLLQTTPAFTAPLLIFSPMFVVSKRILHRYGVFKPKHYHLFILAHSDVALFPVTGVFWGLLCSSIRGDLDVFLRLYLLSSTGDGGAFCKRKRRNRVYRRRTTGEGNCLVVKGSNH